MEIITDRLLIRELKPEDEEAFIGMASDGSLTDIFGDCRNCRQWMGGWIREARALCEAGDPFRDYLAYSLETREDHVVIGSVGSTYYEDAGQVGVTYFIGAACRGRGYMTEALRAFAAHLLRTYPLEALCATVRAANPASGRVLEKAGFLRTGTRPYQDLHDSREELYHFYRLTRDLLLEKGGMPWDL